MKKEEVAACPERGTFPTEELTEAVPFTLRELGFLLDSLQRSQAVYLKKGDPKNIAVGRMRAKVMVAYCKLFMNSPVEEI